MTEQQSKPGVSRRHFLAKATVAAAGVAALQAPFVHSAFGATDMEVKIGLIGCGGRGTGALLDAMGAATKVIYPSTGFHTEDVAAGTAVQHQEHQSRCASRPFPPTASSAAKINSRKLNVTVPAELCFTGFDAYKKLLAVGGSELCHSGNLAALPPGAFRGGGPGGQACLHGEAGRGRRARRQKR